MQKIIIIQSLYKNDNPEYLLKSMNSILCQTYHEFTYYIGIDGPIGDDLSQALYSFDSGRIKILENKENKGLAGILNDLLIECEKGEYEYIVRMDSDDIADPKRIKKTIGIS
jgi:Predicted glycosyltransferases